MREYTLFEIIDEGDGIHFMSTEYPYNIVTSKDGQLHFSEIIFDEEGQGIWSDKPVDECDIKYYDKIYTLYIWNKTC